MKLLIDFDGVVPARLTQRVQFVCRAHRVRVTLVEVHRTRHGYHVIIHITRRVSFMRAVLMQALIGSDWKRETFNSRRAIAWRDVPAFWRTRANVLYQRHYRRVELMSNDNRSAPLSYGEMIPKLTPDDTDGKPVALTIRRARRQNMAPKGKPEEIKIVIEFAELFDGDTPDKQRREYVVNSGSYKTLSTKHGTDETKWVGKPVVMAVTKTTFDGNEYEKQHVATPDRWEKVLAASAKATTKSGRK